MNINRLLSCLFAFLACFWRVVVCQGQIISWQTFQNYGNLDMFNQFTIVFKLQTSLISSDIIKLTLPFSIGDLRQYPIIQWYSISENTCVFNYLPYTFDAVQLDQVGSLYEYSLAFSASSQFMSSNSWYQMQIQSGALIPSTFNSVVIKIGMATYSGISKATSVLYDQNLALSTIYIQPSIVSTLVLSAPNQFFNAGLLQTNRVALTIKQQIIEPQGRILIQLSSAQYKFSSTSVCNSVNDLTQSNVVVMQSGTFNCTVTPSQLELIYVGQPTLSQRLFIIQFDIINSPAQDSLTLIVYQMEPYTNLLLDKGTFSLLTTSSIVFSSYNMYLGFGKSPSSVFQLYKSLPDYSVYNTITLSFQPQISTPDTLGQIVVELGTAFFTVLQGSIYENLPNYNPSIQTNCQFIVTQIICTGVGSLSQNTVYSISFKLQINYSYSINSVPSNFVNFSLIQTSSGSTIISQSGIQIGTVQNNAPKITSSNTFAASFSSTTLPPFVDAIGQLTQLQFDPSNPTTTQVLGFMIKDDGTAVVQDNQLNKGYLIYTTPAIQTNGNTPACQSKTGTSLANCVVSAQSDMTTFRFIGAQAPFQPQSLSQMAVILMANNIVISSFGQMGGNQIYDFYVQTYQTSLQGTSQTASAIVQSYLVNSYVFSLPTLAGTSVKAEIINYLGNSPIVNINGFNTISFLKISTNILATDTMLSANYDYPLRVEIFFDSLVLLPYYSASQQQNITDPYEKFRIQCVGSGISCYSIPLTNYYNPNIYSYLALNRIQIQFADVTTMTSFNSQSILIPFFPVQNVLSLNMFLALSQGVLALGLKKPQPSFKQINSLITFTFRDASLDTTLKYNNYNNVNYNLQGLGLGQTVSKFQIAFNYQAADPVPQLTNTKYIIYTTQWNFTSNFVPSTAVPSFLSTVQDNTGLTCQQMNYNISSLNYFGLLCPLITSSGQTPISFLSTYITMLNIQIPYIYGIELPVSAVSIADTSGNLRSFSYLNSKNRLSPTSFTFLGMTPEIVMEMQMGLEITFQMQTTNQLPPSFIFQVYCTDTENTLNFNPVTISNGCILNSNITISSILTITPTLITCSFSNVDYISAGNINILVVSISVLQEALTATNTVEYSKTLNARFYTNKPILIAKSTRGRKLLYQRQRQYGDSTSYISLNAINVLQLRADNFQISFTLNFIQKDWDDFENLTCNFSSLLSGNPSNTDCQIVDITNNKQNFISSCSFTNSVLVATRNLDITLYPVTYAYSYQITITNIGSNLVIPQGNLNLNNIFSCSTIEPSSNNAILSVSTSLSMLQLNYNVINVTPNGPAGDMVVTKQYSYPGLVGQIEISFNANNNQVQWDKNTLFLLSFPSRYISGLANRDQLSCYQNNIIIPCAMVQPMTLQIESLNYQTLPSSLVFQIIGIQEPTAPLVLDNSGNAVGFIELLVLNSTNNYTLSYYQSYDTAVPAATLSKVRFLNSSISQNQTYLTSDYNFTFTVPSNTPQKTKLVLEFPYSFTKIFDYYQPDSCTLYAPSTSSVSLECIPNSNRIFITSAISNTFSLSSGIQYTLSIKNIKNPFLVTRCNTDKVNLLVFDDSTTNKQLLMVSGESQSAARNVTLTQDTILNSFNVSQTYINLVYGVISSPITIFINSNIRSNKSIEFSNNFNSFIQINPTTPIIPIGEYKINFTISVIDPTVSGKFTVYLSQFSNQLYPIIKDVPPITINIISLTDPQSIKNNFLIQLPFNHFYIPQGGYSLPLVVSLDTFLPQSQLSIVSQVVNLPQNGVQINKGANMTLTANYSSSYLQLQSDATISQIGAMGIIQLSLTGSNANSFYLSDYTLTFEIVAAVSTTSSSNSLQIFINPSTLSPVNQIIQVLSSQSIILYYTVSSNSTEFNMISLNDIINNLQTGIVEEYNYMNQRLTQYGSWTYQGNSGLADFYINNLYESTSYYVKIFPLDSQGNNLGQVVGNFTTSSNSGQLLKTTFRFANNVSMSQQIDFACKMSQYFPINELYLTSTTGIRCDSPSTTVDPKIKSGTVQITALENPNPQYITLYFSYNKEDVYNSYNSQIYTILANQKSTIISWYASQISNNRFYYSLLDYQVTSGIQTAYPILSSSSISYIQSTTWIYISNISLNTNGYVWIMVDKAGNYPPNYLQLRQNLNSKNTLAISNYVSQYTVITNKQIAFNVTGLTSNVTYDFFLAITSDDSSENMTYQPLVFTITIPTK